MGPDKKELTNYNLHHQSLLNSFLKILMNGTAGVDVETSPNEHSDNHQIAPLTHTHTHIYILI